MGKRVIRELKKERDIVRPFVYAAKQSRGPATE